MFELQGDFVLYVCVVCEAPTSVALYRTQLGLWDLFVLTLGEQLLLMCAELCSFSVDTGRQWLGYPLTVDWKQASNVFIVVTLFLCTDIEIIVWVVIDLCHNSVKQPQIICHLLFVLAAGRGNDSCVFMELNWLCCVKGFLILDRLSMIMERRVYFYQKSWLKCKLSSWQQSEQTICLFKWFAAITLQ